MTPPNPGDQQPRDNVAPITQTIRRDEGAMRRSRSSLDARPRNQ
jgi:hypothetical protein